MSKPIVAIIGKPNVGKSTFFNYLAGSRISIVQDTPGVTRDRVYAETNWRGRNFTLVDTRRNRARISRYNIITNERASRTCNFNGRCNNIFNRCKTRGNRS